MYVTIFQTCTIPLFCVEPSWFKVTLNARDALLYAGSWTCLYVIIIHSTARLRMFV
jgi:hypothetical protein